MKIPNGVSEEIFEDMVKWSLRNPSPGQGWAGRRRINDEFDCGRYVARKVQIEAQDRYEGDNDLSDDDEMDVNVEDTPSSPTWEEMISWGLKNPGPGSNSLVATSEMISDHFDVARSEARAVKKEIRKRALCELSGIAQNPGEEVSLKREGDNKLSASFTMNTEQGEEPTLSEALENPKLKRAVSSTEINLDDFRVKNFECRSWDVTMHMSGDRIEKRTNHHVGVKWERKAPNPIITATRRIVDQMPDIHKPTSPTPQQPFGSYMCEIALYDIHYGALAWAAETGQDYDVNIASEIMAYATDQIVERTKYRDIDHYLLPIGNDYMHLNDVSETTPRNGNKLDVDSRLPGIITKAEEALFYLVDELKKVAPVKLIWIPGNHDPQTSYFILRTLHGWYRKDEMVNVDTSPKPRKVLSYGPNMLAFMHGCNISKSRKKELPNIIMQEALDADCLEKDQYREIHMGHRHTKGELSFKGTSSHGSFVIRSIPSIAGTDFWHFSNAYVQSSKTAQFFMWPKDAPLESVQDVHIPLDFYEGSRAGNSLSA